MIIAGHHEHSPGVKLAVGIPEFLGGISVLGMGGYNAFSRYNELIQLHQRTWNFKDASNAAVSLFDLFLRQTFEATMAVLDPTHVDLSNIQGITLAASASGVAAIGGAIVMVEGIKDSYQGGKNL